MRSAHSSTLKLSRIAACTLTALALLSACGSKDAAQAGPGGPGGKMPPPQVGVKGAHRAQRRREHEAAAADDVDELGDARGGTLVEDGARRRG